MQYMLINHFELSHFQPGPSFIGLEMEEEKVNFMYVLKGQRKNNF